MADAPAPQPAAQAQAPTQTQPTAAAAQAQTPAAAEPTTPGTATGAATTDNTTSAERDSTPTPAPAPASAPTPTPAAESTIEADPEGYAEDEGFEADAASRASTSISSSVRDYQFENNRRYHKFQEGRYVFPNDEPEQEREDMKHAMIINLCDGALHFAPLENPQKILDVGTGTGIWCIDMGDEYPGADILGIDLSPIQPPWVPPNVQFMIDDAEATWLHKPNSFDYIHIRHMTSSIRDWPKLISQAYTALKPGGWIELQELRFVCLCDDDTLKEGDPVDGFLRDVKAALAVFGVDLLAMERNPSYLHDGGFTQVSERRFKIPIGRWPLDKKMKTIGEYNRCMIYDGLQGISMGPFTRGLKWSPTDVEVYLVGVRKALMNSAVHRYYRFHVTIGQKPYS